MRARRVDFMFASPSEYPFAILYFTGSKTFNTVMRQRALELGYTMNEHGFHHMTSGNKGAKFVGDFPDERSIFKFLGMEYREPSDRKDTRSVKLIPKNEPEQSVEKPIFVKVNKSKRRTLKKRPSTEDNLVQLKTEGAQALKTMTESELSDMIRAANNAYYCNNNSLLTDNEYDILCEFTIEQFPGNIAADEGHTACVVVAKDKAQLPYEMWSMDKIKPDTVALGYWTNKYKGPYILTAKLDGVSGLYSTEGGQAKLYTRGNGVIGQDISHMIPHLKLPTTPDIVIRGELIIPKELFAEKYASKFSNPRNFVAGVVNKKTMDADKYRDIDFVAYEVIRPTIPVSEQMRYLTSVDIEVVRYLIEQDITNELLSKICLDWRYDNKYEIDGVIVAATPNKGSALSKPRYCKTHSKENPDNAFAFKMVISDQVAETKVLSVIWTANKHGLLKPRVQVERVVLGGANIEFATGFNAKFIENNHIGVGALVQIVRSGDVIPHILSVVTPSDKAQLPNVPYEWNDTHVDVMLKGYKEDAGVREKTITAFFKAIGVEGVGPGNVKRIILSGYNTIPDILRMSVDDLLNVDRFKRKSAEKIHAEIDEKLREATLPQLMAASNIFGRGFGTKKFDAILDSHPDIIVSDENVNVKEAKVMKVHGVAAKSARQFIEELPRFVAWMRDANLGSRMEFKAPKLQGDPTHALFGKVLITTGISSKEKREVAALLKNVGASLGTSVKEDTIAVIVSDPDEDTEKASTAHKLGVPLLLVNDFIQKYLS
jgi:NAD-dependent DNA ligase